MFELSIAANKIKTMKCSHGIKSHQVGVKLHSEGRSLGILCDQYNLDLRGLQRIEAINLTINDLLQMGSRKSLFRLPGGIYLEAVGWELRPSQLCYLFMRPMQEVWILLFSRRTINNFCSGCLYKRQHWIFFLKQTDRSKAQFDLEYVSIVHII